MSDSVSGTFTRRGFLGGVAATAAAGSQLADPARATATTPTPGTAVDGLTVAVSPTVVSAGMPMVGYNIGHCLPGANTATWLDYSGINAARLFAAFSEWCPDELFDAGVGVTDVADFDARVDSLRADPQGTRFSGPRCSSAFALTSTRTPTTISSSSS